MPCIALGSGENLRSVSFADPVGNFHVHKNAMLFTVLEELFMIYTFYTCFNKGNVRENSRNFVGTPV